MPGTDCQKASTTAACVSASPAGAARGSGVLLRKFALPLLAFGALTLWGVTVAIELDRALTAPARGDLLALLALTAGFVLVLSAGIVVRRAIRQREQAAALANHAQARLFDMADASSDWLWETGPDHRFTFFTAGAWAR